MVNLAAKEVTVQVRYMPGSGDAFNKTYNGLKSEITDAQIKALAQFFQQLTNDEIIMAYKITKEAIPVDE